jgi:hypothetical protein
MMEHERNLTPLQRQRNEQQRRDIAQIEATRHRERVLRALDAWRENTPEKSEDK